MYSSFARPKTEILLHHFLPQDKQDTNCYFCQMQPIKEVCSTWTETH